jgi:pimeloyl-ACP methyl ester carboxylesterase
VLVELNGIEMNYEEAGDGGAPGVVLLHGFTADLRMWKPQVEALAADYRVIAPDLRGHGLTSAPEDLGAYTIEAYAEDLRALLDHLELDVAAVVGCSFGGMVALQFATMWPERVAALAVTDSSPAPARDDYDDAFREREARIDASTETVRKFGTARLGKEIAAAIADPFLAEGLRKRYERMSTAGFLGSAKARRERPDLTPVLAEKLTMPVLLCWGEADATACAGEAMARALPRARIAVFRETGHGVPTLRPDAFNRTLLSFFEDVERHRPVEGRRAVS